MWHFRFFGAIAAVLALLGFMEARMALAAHPSSLESSLDLSPGIPAKAESFQIAVMGNSAIPMDMPSEPFVKKAPSQKPAAETPKAIPRASTPEKKKIKQSVATPAPANPPVEEEGFLTKTFNKLVGNSDASKEAAPKAELQKMADKNAEPAKEEEGLLTRTLKSLVGGDEKKEEKKETKNNLNPLNMAPTGSATQQKEVEQPKTAKSETKQTLKDSFEKLIGVGSVEEKVDPKTVSADPVVEKTQSAETKKSGGLLDNILGGGDKKEPSQQAKAKVETVEKKAPEPDKPRQITAREYVENEQTQLEEDRGGVKKGKNLLKESFKTLVAE